MIRTQVYFPEELFRELHLMARSGDRNFSQLVREGAKEMIKKRRKTIKPKWKDFVGACKSKVKTDAVKEFHDYYKYHAL